MSVKVYSYRNLINNKRYIGQTWLALYDRYNASGGYKGCRRFYNALQKYGVESFHLEILWEVDDCKQELVDWVEDYYIKKYDSVKKGYNLKFGGYGGKHSTETKQLPGALRVEGELRPVTLKITETMERRAQISRENTSRDIGFPTSPKERTRTVIAEPRNE